MIAQPIEQRHLMVDLGMSPLSNAFLNSEQLHHMEPFYPLRAMVRESDFLVQLDHFAEPENIFHDYAYFSSYSDSWLAHAKAYVDMAAERFKLDAQSQVIELASNDGYLLQYFVEEEIPVLGIEPAANVAAVAQEKGIPTLVQFFGVDTADTLARNDQQADLLIGNNVLAHVPDLDDFIGGMKIVLKADGVLTMEFPHILQLIQNNQFDTIYHEHFSYFSFLTVEKLFALHGLTLFDVEELPTHGGSLRIYGCHSERADTAISERVIQLRSKELQAGLDCLETYLDFGRQVQKTKRQLLQFMIAAKEEGKTIVGYGAPAKGNTLLNYCGIRSDLLTYTVDRSPHKQGLFLPGTHIPIYTPQKISETKPDYVLILPWNLKNEIMAQMAYIREWGGQFVAPIPEVEVLV